jgi:predicted RNase H-like HicB family nuclease
MEANIKFTAIFEEDPEGGYIGYVEEFPGVNTQGDTLDEVKENLLDALEMMVQVLREQTEKLIKNKKNVIREELHICG